MAGETLNDFLSDDAGGPDPAPEPDVVVEPAREVVVEAPVVEKPPEEEPQLGARVPVAALQAERQQRQDWKEKAVRTQAEIDALRPQLDELAAIRAQLAELQRARAEPPAAPVPPPAPEMVPNPVEDPQGFVAYQQRERQRELLNERANMSEALVRDQYGDADVDAKKAFFMKAAQSNPALIAEAQKQPHPYKWIYAQVQRMQAMEEIGPDPLAFRSKIEADLRAKWEAEQAGAAQRAPEPVLPQSLAGVRNSGTRGIAEEEAPEFDQIFDKGRFRKARQT